MSCLVYKPTGQEMNPFIRRLSRQEEEEIHKQVEDALKKWLIEPSVSPYGAPVLFVQKKKGSLRMCIDYHAWNKITVRDRYPLPRIDDLLDKLHGCTIFSSLDLQIGYHQIRIKDEDEPKTAMMTPMGQFQFKVLCFGLSNAPATFQKQWTRFSASTLASLFWYIWMKFWSCLVRLRSMSSTLGLFCRFWEKMGKLSKW